MSKSLFLETLEQASREERENVTITCYFNWKNAELQTLDLLAQVPCPLFEGLGVRTDYLVGGDNMAEAYRIRGKAQDVLDAFNTLRCIPKINASISKFEVTKPVSYYKRLEGRQVATKVLIRGREGDADTLNILHVEEDSRATSLYKVTVEGKDYVFTYKETQLQRLLERGEFTSEFIKYTLL